MEEIGREIERLEQDLREIQNECEVQLLGHPYSKEIYEKCGEKITLLKNEISQLEKEEARQRAKNLREEINRLREEHEQAKAERSE
jgi:uncharacterized membrane-anchored protein